MCLSPLDVAKGLLSLVRHFHVLCVNVQTL